jgi:membrane protease YdiL (CAAX protease family)
LPVIPSATPNQPVAPAWHTWFYLSYRAFATWAFFRFTVRSQSYSPHSQVRFFLFLILSDVLVLCYIAWGVRKRQSSLRELVGGHWTNLREFLSDCKTALIFWVASLFIFAGFRVLLHLPPSRDSLARLIPHSRIDLSLWFFVAVAAGVTEEIMYRGYL